MRETHSRRITGLMRPDRTQQAGSKANRTRRRTPEVRQLPASATQRGEFESNLNLWVPVTRNDTEGFESLILLMGNNAKRLVCGSLAAPFSVRCIEDLIDYEDIPTLISFLET